MALVFCARRADADGIGLTIDKNGPVILGEDSEVPVTITAPETSDTADRPLRLSVNVGAFGEVVRTGPGTYRATYFPPPSRFPQVALVAVWRETGPDAPIDFLRIPLSGRTKLPVKSKPGAQIRVLVGEQRFGPVLADRQGKALVPIAVPPGVFEVVATSSKAKEQSQGTVAVDVPPYNRLTLAITPYLVAADGESAATAHVFYDSEADPPPIERIEVTADRVALEPAGAIQNHYRFRFVPARGTKAAKIELRAAVAQDKVSHAEATLSIGLPIPERVVSRGLSAPLFADRASRADLRVLVLDRLGLGVSGLSLTATTGSSAAIAQIREIGLGEYAIALLGPGRFVSGGKIAVTVAHARSSEPPLRAVLEVPVEAGRSPQNASAELGSAVGIAAEGVAPLRTSPPVLTLAPLAGIAYLPRLVPAAGVRAALRPRAGDRSFELYGSATYREVSRDVIVGDLPGIAAKLALVPIALGATYDLYLGAAWRTYLGLAVQIVPYRYATESLGSPSRVARGVAPGGEAVAGVGYKRVFLELELSYASIRAKDLAAPGPAGLLVLGYRFGVF